MPAEIPTSRNPSFVSSAAASPSLSVVATAGTPQPVPVASDFSAIEEGVYVAIGHGPYQYRILLCGILASSVAILHIMSSTFLMRPVDHWCKPPLHLSDLPTEAWKNMSIPVEADGSFSKCTMFNPAVAGNLSSNRSTVPCQGWDYDIVNKADSIISRYNLVCGRLYLLKVRSFVALAGPVLTIFFFGFASDTLGRRPVLHLAAFLFVAGAVSNSVAQAITFDIFTRAVMYVGFNSLFMLTFMLLYEVTGSAWRPLFVLIDTAVAGALVPQIARAISLVEPSWVISQTLLLAATMVTAALSYKLGESPVWLLCVRDMERAELAILDAAKVNGMDTTKTSAIFHTIRKQLSRMDRTWQTSGSTALVAEDLSDTAKMRRRAASVFFARFTLSVIFQAFLGGRQGERRDWNTTGTFLLVACYVAVGWAMIRHGLRETLSALLVIVCVCSVAEALSLGPTGTTSPLFDSVTRAIISGAMSVVYCYSAQVFPTRIRGAGMSLSLLCNAAGMLVGIFLLALNRQRGGTLLSTLSAAMSALSVWAVQWLPDIAVQLPALRRSQSALNEQERKEALKSSLSPADSQIRRKRRKRKVKSPRI